MKALLANKALLAVIGGIVVIGIGATVYLSTVNKGTDTQSNKTTTSTSDDFIKTGENSFGLDVCNEMTKAQVGQVIGMNILKTQDYSNSGSTGCEYYISDTGFVIVDVGFGDMADQKKGLAFLDRTIKTDSRIKLENFLAYTEKGLTDIYMNIAPGQKYVRVGRSSNMAPDEETLIKLAMAVETKIRSYK